MKGRSSGFIRLDHDLVRGKTWASLSSHATRLLIGIWSLYNGRNNGKLRYSVAQATRLLHCGRSTALRTFAELQAARLIEATERGSFAYKNGARKGTATAWHLTFLDR